MNEEVMVVETSALAPYLAGRTFDLIEEHGEELLELIESEHLFIDRAVAERSPQYRQIIPYVLIVNDNQCFVTRRLRTGNEARLHDKISLGIGGHINPGHDLLEGLQKELDEEVTIDGDYEIEFAGILNDESAEVGRVHLGAVYILRSDTAAVTVRETEKITGHWHPISGLTTMRDAMETWSQIVFDRLLASSGKS